MYKRVILLCLSVLSIVSISAQTSFYKCSKIVNQGKVTTCSDDGHYITFGLDNAYDSDKNGYQQYGSNMKYLKTENNIKVYYGTGYRGTCNWFIAMDNSRINEKTADGTIYVYERCSPSSSITMRPAPKQQSGGYMPVPNPPLQVDNGVHQTTTISSGNQRKTCPSCNGSGKGYDKITYQTSYTGKYEEEYCVRCGKWGFKHYHQDMMCRTCYGKGYIEY